MNVAGATEVTMPKLSDSMEEGTILSWLVAPGTEVAVGDDLLEVETDKANMSVQAEVAGVIEILAEEGETLPIGAPIARIGPGGGGGAATSAAPAPSAAPVTEAPAPGATPATPVPAVVPRSTTPPTNGKGKGGSTPLARRIARTHGIDLATLSGTGIGGRITKVDVLAAAGVAEAPAPAPDFAAPPAPTAPAGDAVESAKGKSTIQEPSRLQALIARRMSEAKATVPHFQVATEVNMNSAIELRAELKRVADGDPVPSFNDLIVRAAALALREHPKANGSYKDGSFELHKRINVGIAVAADDALIVPTIVDADRKSLGEIGRESRRLAERVRSGTVTPPELAGGTFTVSNLGMFGMTQINPVINLPQAAILGVGMTRDFLRRGEDGEIEDVALMNLTLSCDHRILYGAEAAEFLGAIRNLLEHPLRVAL